MAENLREKQPTTESGGRPLLRRADQAVVAALVGFALVAMVTYWFANGGHRGELIVLIGLGR